MKLRVVDWLLLVIIAIGGVYLWRSNAEKSEVRAEERRLLQRVGDLQISDPSKVHFLALETSDPMVFEWRVYYPPNLQSAWRSSQSPIARPAMSGPSTPLEFIARLRFRETADERLVASLHLQHGVSEIPVGEAELGELLRGRWEELDVLQLGRERVAVVDPDKETVVLRLAMSNALRKKAEERLAAKTKSKSVPIFFELKFGGDAFAPALRRRMVAPPMPARAP